MFVRGGNSVRLDMGMFVRGGNSVRLDMCMFVRGGNSVRLDMGMFVRGDNSVRLDMGMFLLSHRYRCLCSMSKYVLLASVFYCLFGELLLVMQLDFFFK